MDFQSLMAKMRELDQPTPVQSAQVEACGDPMGMPAPPMTPPPSPPSLSINLNAQGMDNIESIMKLMTKVNPDMINQPAPMSMPLEIPIAPPKEPKMGPLGNLDSGPLKMLPDLDMDSDKMPGDDDVSMKQGDLDNDGDHDMDDHDMEKDDKKKDEWANEPDEEYKDVDYMVNKLAGGMNRPKGTYPKVAGGDNPMQRTESTDLRASIKAELAKRLAEAKGVK
jgi:hypothetical protein